MSCRSTGPFGQGAGGEIGRFPRRHQRRSRDRTVRGDVVEFTRYAAARRGRKAQKVRERLYAALACFSQVGIFGFRKLYTTGLRAPDGPPQTGRNWHGYARITAIFEIFK